MTAAHVGRDLLGDAPWLEGLLAVRGEQAVGYAIIHPTCETAYAARGFCVQSRFSLFVIAEERGDGVGRAFGQCSQRS